VSDIDEPQSERELLLAIHKDVKVLVKCQEDHENRIRLLESSFWKVIGLASFISFIAGMFGGKIGGNT
jgi:hypothetical protein